MNLKESCSFLILPLVISTRGTDAFQPINQGSNLRCVASLPARQEIISCSSRLCNQEETRKFNFYSLLDKLSSLDGRIRATRGHRFCGQGQRSSTALNVSNDIEGDNGEIKDEEDDWRLFRAQLVSKEREQMSKHTIHRDNFITKEFESPNDVGIRMDMKQDNIEKGSKSKSWIYESGLNIEKGTILLNHPSETQKYKNNYGLNQQWLHKSVVLVLEHEHGMTSGIILNRPTDLILRDNVDKCLHEDDYDENGEEVVRGWDIWFGGDKFGIHTDHPKFFCLHSLRTPQSEAVSEEIMPGIYFCSLQDAKELVADSRENGSEDANYSHFWAFSGFQTWNHSELEQELKDGTWHAVSTSAALVKRGLRILNAGVRCDGDRTWKILMRLIRQYNTKHQLPEEERNNDGKKSNTFCDLMLKEWSTQKLEFNEPPQFVANVYDTNTDCEYPLVSENIQPGCIVQACSSKSNYLLIDQHFHQSTILILQDDDEMTVGVMLNMATGRSRDFMTSQGDSCEEIVKLPLRFGGPLGGFGCKDDNCKDPLFSLHTSPTLRNAKVGNPVGEDVNGVWRCSFQEVTEAIQTGIAFVEDFAIIDGMCVWGKEDDGDGNIVGGLLKEIEEGRFKCLRSTSTEKVWKELSRLDTVMEQSSLTRNIRISDDAWKMGSERIENQDYDDDNLEELHTRALHNWIDINLIDDGDQFC